MNLTLFDLDGTLIPHDSDHAFGEFLVERGWADATTFKQRNDAFFADYSAGCLDPHAYVEFSTQPWRCRSAQALADAQRDFMAQRIHPHITQAALALVQQHLAAGDLTAMVTATNAFITRPIAQAFGIQHLIAIELVRDEHGYVTGQIQGVPSFKEGKVRRVTDWLNTLGKRWQDFERSTFYSDSTNDLPLLERVSHPVATNPSTALALVAKQRGWPLLKLFP